MVTAKVLCLSKLESGVGENRQVVTTFSPDYNDGRNKEWSVFTPALSLSMTLRGSAADLFDIGAAYTLTFERE